MSEVLKRFWTEQPNGKCTDPELEFGNTHRKSIQCQFYVSGNCHFCDKCDRREGEVANEGWRTN